MSLRIRLSSLTLAVVFAVLAIGAGPGSCSKSKTIDLTIVHTNDIHSSLKPTLDGNPFGLGGMARVKTLVDRIRAQKPNTILLDAGDWSEGGIYFAVDGGANMLRLMNMMGYDATVIGNHDFLNGPAELASTIERAEPSFPILGANKDLSALPEADRLRLESQVRDYAILEVGSGDSHLRVAIVGLLPVDYFYYPYFKPAQITNAVDAAARITKKIYEQKLADVIIVLSHNGFDNNVAWARAIPYANAVVSGHSHVKTPKPVEVSNAGQKVYVVETGWGAKFLGELTLQVNKENRQATLKSFTLHPIDENIPEHPAVVEFVRDQDKALGARFGKDIETVVGETATTMSKTEGGEGLLLNVAATAFREAAQTQIGMENPSLLGSPLVSGALTLGDVYSALPHIFGPVPGSPFPEVGRAWTLRRVKLKGYHLRVLLNGILLGGAAEASFGKIGLSGLRVTYSNSNPPPLRELQVLDPATGQYRTIDELGTYTIALHDGLLLALRILNDKLHLGIDLSNTEDTGIEAWLALLDLINRRGGRLTSDDFEPGIQYRTLEGNLEVFAHRTTTALEGSEFVTHVVVKNSGLAPTSGMTLGALRSNANEKVTDDLPGNEKIPLVSGLVIPTLGVGESAELVFRWTAPGPGLYAVRLNLEGKDGEAADNHTIVHVRR